MDASEQDPHAIEEVVAESERFQSDPEAFCQLLTQEVTMINVVGVRLHGRDTVQSAMEEAMTTSLAPSNVIPLPNLTGLIAQDPGFRFAKYSSGF